MNSSPQILRFPSSTLSFTKKLLPPPSSHPQTPPSHSSQSPPYAVPPSTNSLPLNTNPPPPPSSNPPPSLIPPSSSHRPPSPSSFDNLLVEKLSRKVELLEKENSDLILLDSNKNETLNRKSNKEKGALFENIDELKKKLDLERQKTEETSNYLKKSVRELEEENHQLRKIIEENKKEFRPSIKTAKEDEIRKELEKFQRFISENGLENPFFSEFIRKLEEIGKTTRNSVCNSNRDAFYKTFGNFYADKENNLKIEGEKNNLERLREKMNYSSSKNKNKGLENYQTSLKMRGREMSVGLQKKKLIS